MFKLTPPLAGQSEWTETVLYRFKGGNDGVFPGGLIFDGKGALYGTTFVGGISARLYGYPDSGTVFKLTPPAANQPQWAKTLLYSFQGGFDGIEGQYPGGRQPNLR